jgi:hypothetical protein
MKVDGCLFYHMYEHLQMMYAISDSVGTTTQKAVARLQVLVLGPYDFFLP